MQATIIEPSQMADEHRFLEEEQSPGADDADPLDGSDVAGPIPGRSAMIVTIVTSIPPKKRNLPSGPASTAIIIGTDGRFAPISA